MSEVPKESIQADLQDGAAADYKSDLGEVRLQTARLPGMTTRSGYTFPYIDINYQTFGNLSPAKDNAILITHALSGSAHVAGILADTAKPGWWDHYVGPGKPIDTDRFFVICSNVLGGCSGSTGPTSVDPNTQKPYNMSFPPVMIQDMVKAQTLLIDSLGIDRLFAVVGGSMGGMQALSWAVDFPERLHLCVPIASTMNHSTIQIAFNEVGRQAILTDPNWNNGDYADHRPEHGLAVARMIGHVTYLSESVMENKFGRRHQRPPRPEDVFPVFFAIESYLQHQGLSFVNRFDPNTYLYITKALDMFDLLDGRNPDEVLADVRCRFLIISFESDWLYPPKQSREMARILRRAGKVVTYLNLDTEYGHDSFLIQNPPLQKVLDSFLDLEYKNLQEKAQA